MAHPLRTYRASEGLTLSGLAERIKRMSGRKVSPATLSRIETGVDFPSMELLARITDATGLDPRDFLPQREVAE